MTAITDLARQLRALERKQSARTPQLAHSSFEDGSIGEYVSVAGQQEPQLVARYGMQWDGAHVAASLAGPVPPTPSGITALAIPGGLAVHWDGTWEPLPTPTDETVPTPVVAPSDFLRVEVHLDPDPALTGILFSTLRGYIESPRGGELQVTGLDSEVDYYIRLTARTQSGKFSPASAVVGPVRAGKRTAQEVASMAASPNGIPVMGSRFGEGSVDRYLATDPLTGETVASIGETGHASFAGGSISGPFSVAGKSFQDHLDELPRGEMGRAGVESSLTATSGTAGAFDFEFTAEPGRSYQFFTTTLNLTPSTASTYVEAALRVRPSADGPPTIATSKTIVAGRGSTSLAGGVAAVTLQKSVSFAELFAGNVPPNGYVPTKVRVWLTYGVVSGGGTVGVFGGASHPIHVWANDAGRSRPFTGVMNDGSGTTAALVTESVLEFPLSWARSYNGDDTAERSTVDLVQGYTPDVPAAGSAVSLIGFDPALLDGYLPGATILRAFLYLKSTHWALDSGGQVVLGTHSLGADPGATRPTTGLTLDRTRYDFNGKFGEMWIELSADWFAGLKDGSIRGFTLGNLLRQGDYQYAHFRRTDDPSVTQNVMPMLRFEIMK